MYMLPSSKYFPSEAAPRSLRDFQASKRPRKLFCESTLSNADIVLRILSLDSKWVPLSELFSLKKGKSTVQCPVIVYRIFSSGLYKIRYRTYAQKCVT